MSQYAQQQTANYQQFQYQQPSQRQVQGQAQIVTLNNLRQQSDGNQTPQYQQTYQQNPQAPQAAPVPQFQQPYQQNLPTPQAAPIPQLQVQNTGAVNSYPREVVAGFDTVLGMEFLYRQAQLFSASTMLPQVFQNNPANCAIVLHIAHKLGIDPLIAFQQIYIVKGRPGFQAAFLIMLFNRSKDYTRIEYQFDGQPGQPSRGCTAYTTEIATGRKIIGTRVSLDMALKNNWGPLWKSLPELMLKYRAATYLIRLEFPEITMGFLTKDELEDIDSPMNLSQLSNAQPAQLTQPAQPTQPAPQSEPVKRTRRQTTRRTHTETQGPETIETTAASVPAPEEKPVQPQPQPQTQQPPQPQAPKAPVQARPVNPQGGIDDLFQDMVEDTHAEQYAQKILALRATLTKCSIVDAKKYFLENPDQFKANLQSMSQQTQAQTQAQG